MCTDVILEGITYNKDFFQMGIGTFLVQIMKTMEHRNCGWTDLKLGSLNHGGTIQFEDWQ